MFLASFNLIFALGYLNFPCTEYFKIISSVIDDCVYGRGFFNRETPNRGTI